MIYLINNDSTLLLLAPFPTRQYYKAIQLSDYSLYLIFKNLSKNFKFFSSSKICKVFSVEEYFLTNITILVFFNK